MENPAVAPFLAYSILGLPSGKGMLTMSPQNPVCHFEGTTESMLKDT